MTLTLRSAGCLFAALLCMGAGGQPIQAQTPAVKKELPAKSVYNGLPSGYSQLGTTALGYRINSQSVDFVGRFGNQYYSSTYSNGGYRLAMKVDGGSAGSVDCAYGTTMSEVRCTVRVEQQGEFGRLVYVVENTRDTDAVVSLGTHADIMIGNNDSAPITRKRDSAGNPYGVSMADGGGAQLCVLLGSGLVGVTAVSDYWFGYYGLNSYAEAMTGSYSGGSNFMLENGSYDSGMGWCWKERTIPAGTSVEFAVLIGVGDVTLEPNSSFEVTPDDPEGWNDLSRPHRLTLEGDYESPAGQKGCIEYAVEDSEEWHALTEELESGSTFTASLTVQFDPLLPLHKIRFRTVDALGNTSMLPPITYHDVAYATLGGIESKTFDFGNEIFQTDLACSLPEGSYRLGSYFRNKEAGIASFNIEGVFPASIGRKTYGFEIKPLPLPGELEIDGGPFVFDDEWKTPSWTFTDSRMAAYEATAGVYHSTDWSGNRYPGTATLTVTGQGNFCGTLTKEFVIEKAPLTDKCYSLRMPEEDITYDGNPHPLGLLWKSYGVGELTVSYRETPGGTDSEEAPREAGTYEILAGFEEGECYLGKPKESLGKITIYELPKPEWDKFIYVCQCLDETGERLGWWGFIDEGIKGINAISCLKIKEGNVVGLDFSGYGLEGVFPTSVFGFSTLSELNLSGNALDGELTAAAVAGRTSRLKTVDLSGNHFSGNIGAFASALPELVSLDVSRNRFSDIYPAVPERVEHLDFSRQKTGRTVVLDLSDLSVEKIIGQIPTVALYDHKAQSYEPSLSLRMEMEDGFAMTVDYTDGKVIPRDISSQNVFHGAKGEGVPVCSSLSDDGRNGGHEMDLALYFEDGDVNFNGKTDIIDLQTSLLHMFGEYRTLPYNFTAGDLWADGKINVQDIVLTADAIMGHDLPSNTGGTMRACGEVASTATVSVNEGMLVIDSGIPVAAFDVFVEGCTGIEIDKALKECGFDAMTRNVPGGMRLMAWSLAGAELPAGAHVAALCKGGRAAGAVLSDSRAMEIPCAVQSFSGVGETDVRQAVVCQNNQEIFIELPYGSDKLAWRIISIDGKEIAAGVENNVKAGLVRIAGASDTGTGYFIVIAETCGTVISKSIKI